MNLKEAVVAKIHRDYLEEHKNDHPFPLDGSNWSRLAAMRLDHAYHENAHRCHLCENLLTRLHSLDSPFAHERRAAIRALSYWLVQDLSKQAFPMPFHIDETQKERTLQYLDTLSTNPESLRVAEQQWLDRRQKAWNPLPGKYWGADTTEEFESHPLPDGAIERKRSAESEQEIENVEIAIT